jgi:hypothetical protein
VPWHRAGELSGRSLPAPGRESLWEGAIVLGWAAWELAVQCLSFLCVGWPVLGVCPAVRGTHGCLDEQLVLVMFPLVLEAV